MKQIYGIYDVVTEAFSLPSYLVNEMEALRLMEAHIKSEGSNMAMFPDDYVLFHMGEFNQSTGEHYILESSKRICSGKDIVNKITKELSGAESPYKAV